MRIEVDLEETQKLPILTAEEKIKLAAGDFAERVAKSDRAFIRMFCRLAKNGADEAELGRRREQHRLALIQAADNEAKRLAFSTKYKNADADAVEFVFLKELENLGSSFMLILHGADF